MIYPDCSHLTGRRLEICDGTSGLSEEKRQQYIEYWETEGVKSPESIKQKSDGVGAELSRILKGLGINVDKSCGCSQKINAMNVWGPDKCWKQKKEIVSWLVDSSNRLRSWSKMVPNIVKRPFCRSLLKMAIEAERSKL